MSVKRHHDANQMFREEDCMPAAVDSPCQVAWLRACLVRAHVYATCVRDPEGSSVNYADFELKIFVGRIVRQSDAR